MNLSNSKAVSRAAFTLDAEVPIGNDTSYAQTPVNIIGVVFDNVTKERLPFYNVFIVNTLKGSTTNTKGEFAIADAPKGQIQIMATFVGYKSFKKTIGGEGRSRYNFKNIPKPG